MRSSIALTATVVLLSIAGPEVLAQEPDLESILRFEAPHEGDVPAGWGGGPAETIHFDGEVVHAGSGAARIERAADSPGEFSTITQRLAIEFGGEAIELHGFLRTADVDGEAGLWLREDGLSGPVQFTSMLVEKRSVRGTTDWTEYSVQLPLNDKARNLHFGVLLGGQGKVWADDLELTVDGKPLAEAPARVFEKTVLDTDHEFDGGSGIGVSTLTETQVGNVALLGRVWGFLKYHHPRVAAGELHWDYELFRALPAVLEAADRDAARRSLVQWVDKLGVPEGCDPCAEPPENVYLLPDLGWIEDEELLGAELSDRLKKIYANRFAGEQSFYVSQAAVVGNPVFEHDLAYPSQQPPDAGYRILALVRLWNVIEYWFPYRDLLDDDWPSVLREFLPRMVGAADWDAYRLELLELIARIRDTHANLYTAWEVRPPAGKCRWPVDLRFVEGRPTVTALQDGGEGLELGDVIETVDGNSVAALVEAWEPYYAASNAVTRRRDMARFLPRGACGKSTVGIERQGEAKTISVDRLTDRGRRPASHDRPGETFQLLSEDVAYLKLSGIHATDVDSYIERASGTRGLVIDIRNYPSEFVVFALGSRLVDEPTPFARFTVGDPANPGAFTWTEPLVLPPAKPAYAGKVAVLVDEDSVSQAEYTAMAFSAGPRAVVVGSTTAGADGNVSPIPLPGGLSTMISGIGVFYPDKKPTQRVGIVPDIIAKPTVEGIREGRDEVLEAALSYLLGEKADAAAIRKLSRR